MSASRQVGSISRMRGGDAGFLYLETPSMHMHTLKIAVLEASPLHSYDRLVQLMTERLRMLPAMRRRVVPVPFGLNHPALVAQRRIDPSRHYFRHDVGGTGSMRDLERLIGEICSTPLDRDVPLWELHLCEGLADGKVAIVGKIHHAIADGVAANAMLANLIDVGSADLRPPALVDAAEGADVPRPARLLLDALRDTVRQLFVLPALIASTQRRVAEVRRYRRGVDDVMPRPFKHVPRTSFNGPLTPRRSFATVSLPIADLKRVRAAHSDIAELTLNDVVLALTSGALRRWLALHDEHPRSALLAGVPVGLDAAGAEPRLMGNMISTLFTTLATDIEDPRERLRVISTTSRHAKATSQILGTALMEWGQFLPPVPFAALVRAYSRLQGARLFPSVFNAVVSNVPGPREAVTIAGDQIADVFSVGPLAEGVGLNVTVWSYVDRMNFSLLACPDLLPDVEELVAFLPVALAELLSEPEQAETDPASCAERTTTEDGQGSA